MKMFYIYKCNKTSPDMASINVKFYLKDPDKDQSSLILLKSYFNHQRLVYSTGQYIHPQYWDETIQRPVTTKYEQLKKEIKIDPTKDKEIKAYQKVIKRGTNENPRFQKEMDHIGNQMNRYQTEIENNYEYLQRQKFNLTTAAMKELLNKEFRKQIKKKPDQSKFFIVFDGYVEHLKATKSPLTVKKFETLKKRLIEFSSVLNYPLTFESINLNFYDKFKKYLLNIDNPTRGRKGLLNDSIGKYIANLKTFMQFSLDRDHHTNTVFQKKQFKVDKKAKHEIITLTEGELSKIRKLDLSKNPRLEKVRDLFCFCVFTGQRWSDVISFSKEDLYDNTWVFESKKTKELMKIPLLGFIAPALDILKKYDYNLPVISSQKFNKFIKEVGELAKIKSTVKIKRYSGNKLIEICKPKYEFMASHMARRSCITLLLQRGVPPTTIMKLTGHTDLKTLMKYENTSEDALVDALESVGRIDED